MKEIVIVSGKGGTGKTSLAASFAVLAGRAVIADCDVDAADLHLVLAPQTPRQQCAADCHGGSDRATPGGTGKLVCPWTLEGTSPIEEAPSNKLGSSQVVEMGSVQAMPTGGSVKAEGLGDGGWADHRQAALAAATQESETGDDLSEVGDATQSVLHTSSQSRPDPSTSLGMTRGVVEAQNEVVQERHEFRCGHEAVIRPADCIRCGACLAHCRFGAVKMDGAGAGDAVFSIDPVSCEGCGVCVRFCPAGAIDFPERLCGQWMVSQTRCGPMVHARLGVAAENSGKLVSTVRREARRIAEENGYSLVIVDGPPGIGCPVIASITGADFVLIVTEPTLAGRHDLERVMKLAAHFNIPTGVCINKFDINPGISESIARIAAESGAPVLGEIPYDTDVTRAQIAGLSRVEYSNGPSRQRIESLWQAVMGRVAGTGTSNRQNEYVMR